MNRQFSADGMARARLLAEREAFQKAVQSGELDEFDFEKWGQGASGDGRGNIFTGAGRDTMARNKQAKQYGKLSREGKATYRQSVAGVSGGLSATAGSKGGAAGGWRKQMFGSGDPSTGMQAAQNQQRDAKRMQGKMGVAGGTDAEGNPIMSATPGAATPGAGQTDVNPAGAANQADPAAVADPAAADPAAIDAMGQPVEPAAGAAAPVVDPAVADPAAADPAAADPAAAAAAAAAPAAAAPAAAAPAAAAAAPAAAAADPAALDPKVVQQAQMQQASQDITATAGARPEKKKWSDKTGWQKAGSIGLAALTGGASLAAGAIGRGVQNIGVGAKQGKFDQAQNRQNMRAMGQNPGAIAASEDSAERIYAGMEHIMIRKAISKHNDPIDDDHNRKVVERVMGTDYDTAVDQIDEMQLAERESHLAEERENEDVCESCAGWGDGGQNDDCDCEYDPHEVARGGQCAWCDAGNETCEAAESGIKCPYKEEGQLRGDLSPHLYETPLHEAIASAIGQGQDVDLNDGSVNHPESSMATYNLWDHFDEETGEARND